MKLQEFAYSLRYHDWWHMMSDDHSTYKRGRSKEGLLHSTTAISGKHLKLFDLARKYQRQIGPMDYGRGEAWARGYLAVHGVRASDADIAEVIEPKGSNLFDKPSAGMIHWDRIDDRIEKERKSHE